MYAEKGEWHLSKSVSISHIISTVLLVITVVGLAMGAENRLTVVEQSEKHTTASRIAAEAAIKSEIKEVQQEVGEVRRSQEELRRELKADGLRREEKIDRLTEILMRGSRNGSS